MPLSWNEIRNRAHEFSKRWEGESSERAEAYTMLTRMLNVAMDNGGQELPTLRRHNAKIRALGDRAHMVFLALHLDDAVVRHGFERPGKVAGFASGHFRQG